MSVMIGYRQRPPAMTTGTDLIFVNDWQGLAALSRASSDDLPYGCNETGY